MVNLNELNKEQLKAIKITKGPLLILAGAGSGKTRVLTTKIAYLIEQNIAKPYQILAITFTNKAAKEMVGRLKKLIGKIANDLQVSTFHSFGLRIIKENYQLLGYSSNFVIMDSDDSISIIKKILKEFDLDSKLFNPNAIKSKISSAKNELILPKDYAKYAFSDFEKVVLKVYIRYEEMLKISNSVDFDDLQILPLKLFMEHPIILEKYQNKFRYIFIDEYQDTNKVQYLLSKMISKKYQNICVVGDNDQAIYSWRGANYQNILNFEKDYPNTQVILLEQNYRSTQNILKAANSVIINNKDRKDKKLWTTAEIGEQLTFYQAYDEKDEASYALQEIKQLIDKGIPKETIAILYRTNAQSRVVEEACLKENVPYRIVGNFYFYNRQEIKDLLAYLRLIHNEKDNISLLRVINTPRRGIGEKKITELINRANEKN
ncbi:MAG: UvrD-helicase domain-containing protein, partial [Tenericutes bacterium]|nr:UvrD-helicase domain-containing protein [Mycoplasmatota bacterium]